MFGGIGVFSFLSASQRRALYEELQQLLLTYFKITFNGGCMPFGYTMQKFSQARYSLLPPHRDGLTRAIMLAKHYSREGIKHIHNQPMDATAAKQVTKLKSLVSNERGDSFELASRMTNENIMELSSLIDDLANYFLIECLGRTKG